VLVVVIGFVYSMTTTLLSVTTVRGWQGRSAPVVTATATTRGAAKTAPITATAPAPARPFSDAQYNFCVKASLLTGITSMVATKTDSPLSSPLQMLFTLLATVTSYLWGTRLPTAFVKLVHPLVTSSLLVLALFRTLAAVSQRDFLTLLASYKVGSLDPWSAGAGDYLLYVLGPGVVAFAVGVFGRRQLLFRNLPMVATAMLVSSAGGLFATGAFVRLLQLGGSSASSSLVRLSMLARNVTMALAMALTDMIGGNVSIVAMVVCLTGIIGASYGVPLLNALGVSDPICRGLGMGSSAQGLGVAAIANEPDAFAFASVAMILTAVSATTLVSFPAIRNALIRTTTGLPAP
jgi:putative effector of murein hydrolase